jgi:ABC-type uncharacterized transport system YnjBCD ATPase subunit
VELDTILQGDELINRETFCLAFTLPSDPAYRDFLPCLTLLFDPADQELLLFLTLPSNPQIEDFCRVSLCYPTLQIDELMDQEVINLSGGELQRVAIALCLGTPADIYLIDEPSAYLDSEQRIVAAKVSQSVF